MGSMLMDGCFSNVRGDHPLLIREVEWNMIGSNGLA